MEIYSTYSVKIKHFNNTFKQTVSIYRDAVDFLIIVCLDEWSKMQQIDKNLERQQYIEHLIHATKANPDAKYKNFDKKFYKMPTYLRRAAISEAMGKVSSYK